MGQCDVKHIMTLPIITVTSVLKILTYTCVTAHPIRLVLIIVIISVSAFITIAILYISP